MNYLYINGQYITTLKGLKECFLQEEARQLNSSLFDELKDYYRSDEIAEFLCDIGEEELADRIRGIKSSESDIEMMKSLIAVITEEKVVLDFDPMEYLEVVEAGIKSNEAGMLIACLSVKAIKQTNEHVECVLQQGAKALSFDVLLNGGLFEIKTAEMELEIEGDVSFMVDGKVIAKEKPMKDIPIKVEELSFVMKPVVGGTFWMGAQSSDINGTNFDAEASNYWESPVHQVKLDSYYIGETVVTQALWEAVMHTSPRIFNKGEDLPIENVSWNDCQEFIKRINDLTKMNFRLPTEAEWEFAARGGNKSNSYKYAGDKKIDCVAWYVKNSDGKPHPVKSKSKNELGLYDMSGNVYEWCQDWFGNYNSSKESNPLGPSSGGFRVIRGGSWKNDKEKCRVSSRGGYNPEYYQNGFRLCLSFSERTKII